MLTLTRQNLLPHSDHIIKMLLIGASDVGKTALLLRFVVCHYLEWLLG